MGYVDDLQPVITGEITSLTADFSDHAPPTVQVEGYDLLTRLTRGTTYRWFEEPDSAIVKTIAGEMELTPDVDATPARIGRRAQNGVTNLKMLEDLAKANNFFFWVDGQTLFFKKQRPAPGTVQLEYGKTLISFSARLNLVGQVEAVRVRGWDEVQKQEISGRAERPPSDLSLLSPSGQQQIALGAGGQSELLVQETNIASEQEAKTMAEGLMAEQRNTLLTGQGVSVGHPDIHVGTELELIGIGRFDGTYTVGQVTHTINDSGYRTSFQVRRKW
jgi:phage protein D